MKNQKKQLITMFVALLVLVVLYFGVEIYNNQQEEEVEASKTYITSFSSQDIVAFSYDLNSTQHSYSRTDEVWSYDGDTSVDLDETEVDTLLLGVGALAAEETITEYDTLETYGLDTPSQTISFTMSDETTLTLKVGDYNSMVGMYYLMVEGKDTLYMVDSTLVDTFDITYTDLEYVEETTEETTETTEE